MAVTMYQGRRAAAIENEELRVTVLEEGGHIAEVLHKATGVNPMWTPPWRSIEPSTYSPEAHPEFGTSGEAKLLAGLMGHNLCLDLFGGPSADEEATGLTPHGESSVARYEIDTSGQRLSMRARLPLAQLAFQREIELRAGVVQIRESVENLTASDRPIAWTQHVTLGPPFLEAGVTQFRSSATRSLVYEKDFGPDDYLVKGAGFDWPLAPRLGGGLADLQLAAGAARSCAYTAHLMDPASDFAYFMAWQPGSRLAFSYVWSRADFPWMGIWEENRSRTHKPWNGVAMTRGMEFGVSPVPESRREMVERGRLFDTPTFRWLPARGRLEVEYGAAAWQSDAMPDAPSWLARRINRTGDDL